MSAVPLLAVSHAALTDRLPPLRDACIASWRATPAELPRLGSPATRWQQWRNARATSRLIDELATRVDAYPERAWERRTWRDGVRRRLQDFGEARFGWPSGYRNLLFGDAYYEASVDFSRRARAFDPTLSLDDLWQALRNVWIGNSLQMLLSHTPILTPALFAYSMLYPVTDNLLDASDVSAADKRAFNHRFGRRLTGEVLIAERVAETRAFDLVGQIEGEFPRHSFPDVWESVLAIHRGQIDSLCQQGKELAEEQLLDISFAKGGASVLADLYLVRRAATPAEERFAFGYGVFLQLLDDLQDVTTDLGAGHQTLFTDAAGQGRLDELTMRLARFIDVVLDANHAFAGTRTDDCIDLIRRNCRALLVGVIAEQPNLFSRAFRRSVERQWPLGFGAMRRLKRRAQRRFQATAQCLQAQRGVSSPLDLLLADSRCARSGVGELVEREPLDVDALFVSERVHRADAVARRTGA
jgi:hypothetical protein